jgi:hypothetical protein|tara:strand:+ start:249 stop:494 length:246 start_codon:yes stop_codon:yes gene_type:complete
MRDIMLNALKSFYVGNINRHIANVEVYLRMTVGIGEHSDIQETIDKEIEKIAQFDDRLAMVMKYFERKQEDEKKEEKPKSK